ncbi:glucose-6-phosphate dehydrogenase [Candidatus Pacearchaeota archaeon]|nr:glucose-6-phosphate dehydrogenase [Candidatus Pacearchaeota archaeon]
MIDNNPPRLTIVVFGGTGDLMKRKLAPAFASLLKKKIISKDSTIIGIARGDFNDESYKNLFAESAKSQEDRENIKQLKIKFFRGDATNQKSLANLSDFIFSTEPKEGRNRIFYLSTSFKLFPSIIEQLKTQALYEQKNNYFTRIVFEKPFGVNLASSDELERSIHETFSEEQIFRIDHYLAKETVKNISILKYTNPIFNYLLRKEVVESINIIVDEDLGVGNRIAYYNETGAIKDMIQSHLLQVLSLLLMENPSELKAEKIHDEKVKVLKSIEILPAENNLLGQYKSYIKESSLLGTKESKTETFASIVLECNNERWKGVKIVLRTGKMLKSKFGQIIINFRQIPDKLKENSLDIKNNKLIIDIYPKQDIKLILNTRKPATQNEIEEISLDFCHESFFGPNTTDEYATLLADIIAGDKTLFTRSDELRESWKVIEKIERIKDKIPFLIYPDGTDPEDMEKNINSVK